MISKPSGIEAHKLINISLGKIAASRSGRTGASLHKSLLVASVLHKARFVYLEEASYHHSTLYCPPHQNSIPELDNMSDPQQRAPTPVPEVTVTPVIVNNNNNSYIDEEDKENYTTLTAPQYEKLSDDEDDSTTTAPLTENNRKRRRVSEQETVAAVSSILPKRLKSSDEDSPDDDYQYNEQLYNPTEVITTDNTCHDSNTTTTTTILPAMAEDYDDDEECNMEVDHITSLVSIISFSQHQDLCSSQAHHQVSEGLGGLPVLALTA